MKEFDCVLKRDGLSTMKWEYEIKRTGNPDILSYSTADMDFKSPAPILDAIHEIADAGHLGYPFVKDSYYQSIEEYLEHMCGWKIDARKSVGNNVGIYTAVWNILDALTQEGDEVIIQSPVHFCFAQMLRDNNRIVVENPLKNADNRYEIDFEQLEKCFTQKTRLFWLCNPHNPVGRVWTKEELMKIGEICLKHNVKILSDDVYCGLTFEGHQYTPIASLSKEISDITITCYSTSKIYNTTGLKFSYVVAENPEILKRYQMSLQKLDLTYGFNMIGLAVTEVAYRECNEWLRDLMKYVQDNLNYVKTFMNEKLHKVRVVESDGTYFAWLDLRYLGISSDELAKTLEKEGDIVLGSGTGLGTGGDGYLRMNIACPRSILEKGLERFKKVISTK